MIKGFIKSYFQEVDLPDDGSIQKMLVPIEKVEDLKYVLPHTHKQYSALSFLLPLYVALRKRKGRRTDLPQ
jgi:hypothetical protein